MTVVLRGAVAAGLVLGLGAGAATVVEGQTPAAARIAFVNFQQALESMPGYAQAESTWTVEARQAEGDIRRLQEQLDSLLSEFSQQEAMLSPTSRQARRREVDNQAQQLRQQAGDVQNRIARREVELRQPMQQRLLSVLEGMRAEGNYVMIIDVGSRDQVGIITYDRSLDITQRVIERLRQSN